MSIKMQTLVVKNCHSKGEGGALHVSGNLQVVGGKLTFEDCQARSGGAVWVAHSMLQLDNSFRCDRCVADTQKPPKKILKAKQTSKAKQKKPPSRDAVKGGGCIDVGELELQISSMELNSCESLWSGGALLSRQQVSLRKSAVSTTSCEAKGSGGGIALLAGDVILENSNVSFARCEAGTSGGGLWLGDGKLNVVGGMLSFNQCRCKDFGGCLNVVKGGGRSIQTAAIQLSRTTAIFRDCTAGESGGGLRIGEGSLFLENTSAQFMNCKAFHGYGGAVFLKKAYPVSTAIRNGGIWLHHSSTTIQGCTAGMSGGGFGINCGSAWVVGGALSFDNCTASRMSGGALRISNGDAWLGSSEARFADCSAKLFGGAVSVANGRINHEGGAALEFRRTSAGRGSAMYVSSGARLRTVHVEECIDSSKTPVAIDAGNVTLDRLAFVYGSSRLVYVQAGDHLNAIELDCAQVDGCHAISRTCRVDIARCAAGFQRLGDAGHVGCDACPAGTFQLFLAKNPTCLRCPMNARICNGTYLEMKPGFMIEVPPDTSEFTSTSELHRLSHDHHCPNMAACPGGHIASTGQSPMCSEAYTGIACGYPSPGYGLSDAIPGVYIRCPSTWPTWWFQVLYMASTNIIIFCVAMRGALLAKKGRKRSAVLLNQAMSFATVSASCLSAVMQTRTFGLLQRGIRDTWFWSELVVEFLQGNSNNNGSSMDCVGAFLGLPRDLHFVSVMNAALPTLLVALGCFVDPWLSIVIGSNCFLPAVCGSLGRFLVFFRTNPDGKLIQPNLPQGFPGAPLLIPFLIAFCFGGVITLWNWAAHSKADPKPTHVAFLTSAYKEQFAAFETERLVRKMLLMTLRMCCPIAWAPALQLTGTMVVLALALAAYLKLQPYQEDVFNLLEAKLLLSSVVMSALASCVVAQDLYPWSRSDWLDISMVAVIGMLATFGAVMMMHAIGEAMLAERQHEQQEQVSVQTTTHAKMEEVDSPEK
ncbi:ANKRD50 [Symbiodinium microadriaticum]|nr:ANKRD50 [Symbiodinium microadriaticum]